MKARILNTDFQGWLALLVQNILFSPQSIWLRQISLIREKVIREGTIIVVYVCEFECVCVCIYEYI